MRKTHNPAHYAFDVLVELAQQGNEMARNVVAAHPSNGRGKFVCIGCFNIHEEKDTVRSSQGFVLCRECYPRSGALIDLGLGSLDIIHAARPVVNHSTRLPKPEPVSPVETAPIYAKEGDGFALRVPPRVLVAEADYAGIEERILAHELTEQKRPRGRPRLDGSPTGRLKVDGPEAQHIKRPVQPGAKPKIGSPEWKARMAQFMGAK